MLQDEVEQVVSDLVVNNKPFTALDITNAVRKAGHYARHAEVRDIVRDLFRSGGMVGYVTSDIGVSLSDGSTSVAILYHHSNSDASDYTNRDSSLVDTLNGNPPSQSQVLANTTDGTVDDSSDVLKALDDNSLSVPCVPTVPSSGNTNNN